MKKDFSIKNTGYFCAALALLLINDFILKHLYENAFTGKLSDFAGLFVFSLFFTAFQPKLKGCIFLLTAAGFIFWKSIYSQPAINLFNSLGILSISRVVDYTDLLALTILPIAWHFEKNKNKTFYLKIPLPAITVLSLFAFIATSITPPRYFIPSVEYKFKQHSFTSFIKTLPPNIKLKWSASNRRNHNYFKPAALTDSTNVNFVPLEFFEENDSIGLNCTITIVNPSDSIATISAYIKNYTIKDSIVQLSLYNWSIIGHDISEPKNSFAYDLEKEHVKTVFENLFVNPIDKNGRLFPFP
jgi:hypothetical protein